MNDDVFKLEDYLLQAYGYTFTTFEDLTLQDFVEFESIGANSLVWITIDGDKYLFKKIEKGRGEFTWLGELLTKKVADIVGIPAAEYRICKIGEEYGILSKKFTKDNETLILGAQIIQETLNKYPYLKKGTPTVLDDPEFIDLYNVPQDIVTMSPKYRFEYLHNNLNNLEELWSILEIYMKIHGFDLAYTGPIMEYLVDVFMIDLFTIQGDRHMGNWAVTLVKNDDGSLALKTAELFDNSASFNLWKFNERLPKLQPMIESYEHNPDNPATKESFINFLYTDKMLLTPSEDSIRNAKKKKREPNTTMLDYFLKISDDSYVELFIDRLERLKNTDFMELLEDIEKEQHIQIPSEVKEYVCQVMKYNLLLLNERVVALRKESGRGLNG